MAEEKKQPYAASKPGDLWTAEIWNDTQVKIKEDIETKAKELKDEIAKDGVNFAQNADKFSGKTSAEWETYLGQKYTKIFSPIAHSHPINIAKHFKRLTKTQNSASIKHNFNGFPLVDIYNLQAIVPKSIISEGIRITSSDGKPIKFLLYKKEEAENFNETSGYNGLGFRGFPLTEILDEYRVQFSEEATLYDVRAVLWKKMFYPAIFSLASSQAVEKDCANKVTIETLKSNGQWENILLCFCPTKEGPSSQIIKYINYQTLQVGVDPTNLKDDDIVDLMIVLRP
jgi:hypothetical protein